jgi:hypothetical protein
MNVSKEREVMIMSKTEFLTKWRNDRDFRYDMRKKGIMVVQNNVIFFNPDGTVKAVAGAYIQ